MSLRLHIRPEAEQDLEDAEVWYEKQTPVLGQEFLDEVLQSLRQITERPRLYPTVHRNTRRTLTHRFPFGVFYRVEEDVIVVVALADG